MLRPEALSRAGLRCRDGAGSGCGDGDGVGWSRSLVTCAGEELAAPMPLGGAVWPAVELAVSIPFTAQLRTVISPTPMPMTIARRRQ